MGLKALIRFARIMSKGGSGLDKQFDREKQPYIYVGLVCVREPYQGQGDMRKIMDAAFSKGNRLGVPVNLDTDTSARTSPSELRIKQSCVFLATSIPTQIMMIPPVCVYLILGFTGRFTLVILFDGKKKFLEQLETFSINRAALFPEIECVAEYLKNKYIN